MVKRDSYRQDLYILLIMCCGKIQNLHLEWYKIHQEHHQQTIQQISIRRTIIYWPITILMLCRNWLWLVQMIWDITGPNWYCFTIIRHKVSNNRFALRNNYETLDILAPDDLSVKRGDWIYADLNNQTVDGWLWWVNFFYKMVCILMEYSHLN